MPVVTLAIVVSVDIKANL